MNENNVPAGFVLPEPKAHAPMYPDESREDQYNAARYVEGWNACLAECVRRAAAPVAQPPAQPAEAVDFDDWWYGHDGVRQRQVAYLGWPCTKALAETIWKDARLATQPLAAPVQQTEAVAPFVSYYARTEPLPAQGSLHPAPGSGVARHEVNTHANALRSYIDSLSGDSFQGAIRELGALRDIIDGLLATPPTQPAPPPEPVEGAPGEAGLRWAIGHALSNAFGNVGDDGVVQVDPFDSENIDPLVDAVMQVLPAPALPPVARAKMSDDRILEIATEMFPRWREDIQERFVLLLSHAVLSAYVWEGIEASTGEQSHG